MESLLSIGSCTFVRVFTLGRLDVVIDGKRLYFRGRAPLRPLAVLGALIASGGRGVSTGALADLLWPDADGFDAYRALTAALHRLRRVLRCRDAIRLSAGQLSLDPTICQVDVWDFERSVRTARSRDELLAALELYRGPFLGDDPSCWAIATRRRLEHIVAKVRRRLQVSDEGDDAFPADAADISLTAFGLGTPDTSES